MNSGIGFCLPKDDQFSTKHVKSTSKNVLRVCTPNTVLPCEGFDCNPTFDNDNINQYYSVPPTRLVGGGRSALGKEFHSKANVEKLTAAFLALGTESRKENTG